MGCGGIIHVASDCWTVSGVRAMTPFSSKVFVFLKREWRFKTGSGSEFALTMAFGMFAMAAYSVSSMGGINQFMGYLTGSPKIALEEFKRKGLTMCMAKGKFRWVTGRISKEEWLIIGTEGKTGLAFFDGKKLVRQPKNGSFTRMRIVVLDKEWVTARLEGWRRTGRQAFFHSGGKWHVAFPDDVIWGHVIGEELVLADLK